jgi:hypothetical protein
MTAFCRFCFSGKRSHWLPSLFPKTGTIFKVLDSGAGAVSAVASDANAIDVILTKLMQFISGRHRDVIAARQAANNQYSLATSPGASAASHRATGGSTASATGATH